jgi:hypothetical protein
MNLKTPASEGKVETQKYPAKAALPEIDQDGVGGKSSVEQKQPTAAIYPTSDESEAEQLTSVSQLNDVQPTDWAFQALQSLVERYGCIVGYPGGKYLGNRSLSRYEFAAGLNSCLEQVTKLIASSTATSTTKDDLNKLERLTTEFRGELAQLNARVNRLDTTITALNEHQFSPTTKLDGEVETVLGGVLAGNNVISKQPAPRTFTFSDRVTLRLNTSFTGTDQLRTTLSAGNIQNLGTIGTAKPQNTAGIFGTTDGRTSDNAAPAFSSNQIYVSGLRYRFLATKDTTVNIFAQSDGALELGLSAPINPYFEGSAANSISRYGRRNMVFDYGDTGSGIAVIKKFGDKLELGLEYTAINGNTPTSANGLFSGRYTALGQLVYYGNQKNLRIGLTYANSFSPSGGAGVGTGGTFGPFIGSNLANSFVPKTATIANVYGVEAFYRLNPKVAVNGWVGYGVHRYIGTGDGQVWDWAVGLAFPDLFRRASLGGIFVGMEPKLTGVGKNVDFQTGLGAGAVDKNTSLHIEAFYQYQLNDHIAITPGVIWITAPDFNSTNPDSLVGWVRTTFRF